MKARFLTALAVGALACPVTADSIGPGGTFDPVTGRFGDLFTPLHLNSDIARIPISFHKSVPGPDPNSGWAGVRFHLNIIDPSVAVFLGFKPDPNFISTMGPNSSTVWLTNASQSGQTPPLSQPTRLGLYNVHVTGTFDPGDIDIVFKSTVFNIYHVGQQPNSGQFRLEISDWVYVPPGATTSFWGETAVAPPPIGGGTWMHVEIAKTIHNVAASWFFGTSVNITHQGSIGIEIIPAPGAIALLAGGLGMFGLARRRRRVADN